MHKNFVKIERKLDSLIIVIVNEFKPDTTKQKLGELNINIYNAYDNIKIICKTY